jgi:hypoxanthine phosphoribosyltransferase
MLMPWSRRGLLRETDSWQKVVALALLVFEAILLAFIYRSTSADWYVVLIAVTPLLLLIYGVFFSRRNPRRTNPDIGRNIEILRQKLQSARFGPDLIIGLSRGGLVVAARLSYELGLIPPVPTISLWPHHPDYSNALNSFNLPEIYRLQRENPNFDARRSWNILVIDDACKSGRSLRGAKDYVEAQLSGIPHQIRTAALEIERGGYTAPIEPDFFVNASTVSKDAWGEEEEP